MIIKHSEKPLFLQREQNRLYKEIRRRIEETQGRVEMERRLKEYTGLIDEYRKHLVKISK